MDNESKKNPKSADPPAAAEPAGAGQPKALLAAPIILERVKSRKRNRKKKKYSRGTKPFQRLLLGVSKAGFRTSNSLAKGLDTFVKRSNKSARKRRDGLVRDSLRNASRGAGKAFTEAGKAPEEIARRLGTRRVWRVVRGFAPS
ncbi:MAG TPA: hypothetical protein VE075_04990 [Thermoanaerobaculia bacterium]|nr:hypothetical protein [Thermoanaerobaculia bacterium]